MKDNQKFYEHLKNLSSSLVLQSLEDEKTETPHLAVSSRANNLKSCISLELDSLDKESFLSNSRQILNNKTSKGDSQEFLNPNTFIKLNIGFNQSRAQIMNNVEARSSENFEEVMVIDENLKNLFRSAIKLNIERIFKKIEHDSYHSPQNVLGSLKTCSEKIFPCFYKFRPIKPEAEEKLFKLRNFCSKPFSITENDGLFTLYQEIDKKEKVRNSAEFSEKIGLQDIYLDHNDLKKSFSSGVIIHQLYFLKKFPQYFNQFYRQPNGFEVGRRLIEKIFELLDYLRIQKIFDDIDYLTSLGINDCLEIEGFFYLHSRVILLWLQNQSKFKDDDQKINCIFNEVLKNPIKCFELLSRELELNKEALEIDKNINE